MLKDILLVTLTASTLALNAPVASADIPLGDCEWELVHWVDAEGNHHEGALYGWAVHDDGGYVSIACHLMLNGTRVVSTPTASGFGFAAVADRAAYSGGRGSFVACAVITAHGTTRTHCS